ncbi:MAG: choice-of-anchor D domain-containing protein, partial [Terriglobales bacterium]
VASPAVPVIEFQPTGLLFTGVQLGATSAPQTLTLKNLGAGPLTISAIEVGLWFSETDNCGSSLAQGANCTIQVTFTSPFLSAATGTLTVYDNVSDVRLSAALEGFSVSTLQISPCCLSFSQLLGGTSPSQNVTLTNVSTMPIQVDSVVATAGFSATNQCSTIAVAGQCNIMVTFTPTASGTTVGSLSISTNVPNTTAFVVPLSGNATDFSLGSAASVTVAAGRTATYNLSATSIDDFSGSISLSCGGGPMGTTCKVTPSSLALSSGGSNFYSVIVTTTANSMGLKVGTSLPGGQGALLAGLLCLPLLGIVIRRRRGRNVRRIMAIVFLSCLGVVLVSCGSGGGGGGGGNSGTPPGTYNLTVTGQVGSVSNTTVVTLIVQ